MENKVLAVRTKEVKLRPCPLLSEDYSLRPYQKMTVAAMVGTNRFINGDDVGLGKSYVFIATFAYLKELDPKRRAIILCNKSAMYQWRNEFNKFLKAKMKIGVIKASGSKSLPKFQRARIYKGSWDVLIMTYATFRNDILPLIDCIKQNKITLVLDEAQQIRTAGSKITQLIDLVEPLVERAYGLTATIIYNRLAEAHSIFGTLVKGLFGDYNHFETRYLKVIPIKVPMKTKKGKRFVRVLKKVVGYRNLPHFRETIAPYFLGRAASEVQEELPDLVTRDIFVDMEGQQLDLYNQAHAGVLKVTADEPSANILAKMVICQFMANSPALKGFQAQSAKEEELLRLMEDEFLGQKTIIFSYSKQMVNRLCELLKEYTPLKITGDVDAESREQAKMLFLTNPEYKVIVLNTAGAESINLQSAKHLLVYDFPWSIGGYSQLIGRARRIGATEPVIFVHHLMAKDSIDEYKMTVLKQKQDLVSVAVPKGPSNLFEYDFDEGKFATNVFKLMLKRKQK